MTWFFILDFWIIWASELKWEKMRLYLSGHKSYKGSVLHISVFETCRLYIFQQKLHIQDFSILVQAENSFWKLRYITHDQFHLHSLIDDLKDYDNDDSKAYQNIIYLSEKEKGIDCLGESEKEQKQDSSSEGDFVDSIDVHETSDMTNSCNSSLNNSIKVPTACSITKSSSFSGVTERELLRSKLKELYNLYNDISHTDNDGNKLERAGRYHKKAAPEPPKTTEGAIKATLVLKPGVIKALSPPTETTKSELFLAHSPKPKRKSKTPMSRLMMLPKKMAFWNREDVKPREEKRLSWNMFSSNQRHLKPILNTKQYSKSHEELQQSCKFDYLCDEDLLSYNSTRMEDHLRARKISTTATFCLNTERAKTELDFD